ncbi:glycosyltransferase family 4 protein [Desulfobulbus sp.]|uniref:glycosyltransferase family 4 protein n=1 Tax=Desulfobulbus sp. TaxID=895 RepID=UPI0027B8B4FA|nr:glycosyltransferase family 4 protein [Desulfobulbus sp.]
MKPLIFHVRASNFFGGPERQIIGHIQASKEFDHLVVTFQEGGTDNEFQKVCIGQGVAVATIKTTHSYQWSSVQQLRACILEKRPAIICCHGYKPLALSLLAKRSEPMPIIAFSRGHTSENLKIRVFEYIERKLYNCADTIIAVSQGYAEALKRHGIKPERIQVVLNAVQIDKFLPFIEKKTPIRKKLGFVEEDFLIASAGRLSPEKAQADLIAAFSQLCQQYGHIHLVLCGDGPLRESLERKAADAGCRNVHFLGHRTDLDSLMPIFDLFVLPSLTEGLPNVLLEAASCHVPIVATRVGGIPEIVSDGESGLLVDPGNIPQLVQAIEHCVTNHESTSHLARAAYRVIETKYGFTEQARKLENLYRQMLVQGQP